MNTIDELRHHSFLDIIGMGVSFVRTKVFFPGASLVRRPFHLRGDKRAFRYGKGFTTGRGCRFEVYGTGEIVFGDDCHIGDYVHIASSGHVSIGDNALFASKVFISDTSHGSFDPDGCPPDVPPNDRQLTHSYVKIGRNVWLGENVVVLPGASIGDGCVIGANSVVTKSIPADTVAVGAPARPIKRYDREVCEWVAA